MTLHEISKQIEQSFSMEDLSDLCFQLGIDLHDLPGQTRKSKTQALVQHLDRRGRIGELINICKQLRPHFHWEYNPQEKSAPFPKALATRENKSFLERFWLPGAIVLGFTIIGLIIASRLPQVKPEDSITSEVARLTSTNTAASATTSTSVAGTTANPVTAIPTTPMEASTQTHTPIPTNTNIPLTISTVLTSDCSSITFDSFIHLISGNVSQPEPSPGYTLPQIKFDTELGKCILDFNGPASMIIPYDKQFEPENGTIEVIVKEISLPQGLLPNERHYFLSQFTQFQGSGVNVYSLMIDGEGKLQASIYDDVGLQQYSSNAMAIKPNCWHHIAMVWDQGNLALFVDGSDFASGTYSPVPGKGFSFAGTYKPQVGHPIYGDFDGQIAGIFFYDAPRTPTEIGDAAEEYSFCESELTTTTNTPVPPTITPTFTATAAPVIPTFTPIPIATVSQDFSFSCENVSPPLDTCENNNYFACGQTHYLAGDWSLAFEDFESEICTKGGSINNSNLYTWYMRSFYLKFALEETTPSNGDFENAIYACGKAIEFAVNDAQLGKAHFQCGEVHRRFENEPDKERWCQTAFHFGKAQELGELPESSLNNLNSAISRCESSQ